MAVARNLRYIIPARTRTLLKKRFPKQIEKAAIGLDLVPYVLDARNWPKLFSPRPLPHPLSSEMWAGFGERAANTIERLKLSTDDEIRTLSSAAWSLAQWYAHNGDYSRALDNLILLTAAAPRSRRSVYTQLMMVECLLKLGRPEDARRWLQWASKRSEPRPELNFSAANICHAVAERSTAAPRADLERLAWINQVYGAAGFSPIQKRDEDAPLTLDNITVHRPRSVEASAKLSVLMPAYNCADTLPVALTSILNQTWRSLEVIVVDDASSDDTWEVIQRFAQLDSRIVPLRHDRNGGAYAARNTALAHATGDFVTVHDADDWSHPEKFAAQMLYAVSHPDSISTTIGVRISRDLRFDVKANMAGMLMENTSSLLVKRQILVDLGGWDRIRMGADSELYERVKAKYKLTSNKLFPTVPLTFILFSGSSLTQTKAAGLMTVRYGARRQYKEAYRYWHALELAKPQPNLRLTDQRRFPAPRIMIGHKGTITDIDIVVIGDFANPERSFERDIDRWKALANAGYTMAIAHWPTFGRADADVVQPVRATIVAGSIESIVPGEVVSCKAAVVLDTELLDAPPAPLPHISTKYLYVVTENDVTDHQKDVAKQLFACSPLPGNRDYLTPTLEWLEKNTLARDPA